MLRRSGCVTILLFIFVTVHAQVNLQTGSATFSLPMFSWQDNKSRLNSVVALSYNSGNGLKVNDVASNIGQGWNLIAGGVIARLQVGEPDDQVAYNGNGTDHDIRKYPNGYLYATVPPEKGCPKALTKYPIYGSKNQLYTQHNIIAEDKQLDYFSFQFNGKAGMFVLSETGNDHGVSLGDNKMIITFQRDPSMATMNSHGKRTTITSFKIQDTDGLIYKFSKHGITKVLQSSYCDEKLNQEFKQPGFGNNKVYNQAGFENAQFINPYVIGSWYLKEIEDALTERKIIFNYTTSVINNIAGEDVMYNPSRNYSIITHKTSKTETPEISSIVYPDGHNVTFNYGNNRLDLNGAKVLSSVDISYQARYLSKYLLNTTYFILNRYGTPVSAYQKSVARLCLKSVKKIGVDLKEDTPPYIFDYYLGSNNPDDFVPPPFFYAKDIWGFYNGNNSTGYENNAAIPLNTTVSRLNNNQLRGLCFLKSDVTGVVLNPKTGYAKNGLLKQIIYPTGGTLSYHYGQNAGVLVLNGTERAVGGVHVDSTSSTDGGHSNGCATPITTQYRYVMNSPGSASSLWGLEMPVNWMESNNHYNPEYKYYKYAGCFPFGCCDWRYKYPGILSQSQSTSITDFQQAMTVATTVLGILSTVLDVVLLVSNVTGPAAVIIDVIVGLVQVATSCIGNQARDTYTKLYYNSDFNAVSPLPTQFKRVEVIENRGTIGKTVHEFTSSDDFAIWHPTNAAFSAMQRFAPWAYGLPKLTTLYDVNGNKVKQTQNAYDYTYSKSIIEYCSRGHSLPCDSSGLFTSLVSCKCLVTDSYSQRNTNWTDPIKYNHAGNYQRASNEDMLVNFYGMYSGRIELRKNYERLFKTNDQAQYVETMTEYYYNIQNYEVFGIKTTQSDGHVSYKGITYSSDYPGTSLYTLIQNNIIALPVSESSGIIKIISGSEVFHYLDEKVTEFSQLSNGDVKPSRILEKRTVQPISVNAGTWVSYQGPEYNNTSSGFKTVQSFTYDASGNLIGLKDEGNRLVTNIYGYNDKYIIASVINADPLLDKCAYAHFEKGSGWGAWSLNGTPAFSNNAVTGDSSFVLSSPSLFAAPLNTGKSHTVSFWSTTAQVFLSAGATLIKSSPTINGFTYYEYDIAQGTSNVTVSGNTVIDELRLYPKTARMRTVNYDPLIGKTSECDENNRITYYEYDNLGRLRFVKDESKNIVKMHQYNNISEAKQNGCPATYYNHLVSEVFTKSNCGTEYIGSSITYNVPANTYSSVISQADADAQAENNILTNGQSYADANGTCLLLYYNAEQSRSDTSQSCPAGYRGGLVTYTVPAARYYSIISQADADLKATDEIAANAQAYANSPDNAVCIQNTDPDWTWDEVNSYCQSINGSLPPHLFVNERDLNPFSATYNQSRWYDVGPRDECPAGNYYNVSMNQAFTKNDCGTGYTGSSVTYNVSPGKFSSAVSQAAANQLATNDINANGQAYANTNGTCTPSIINVTYNNYSGDNFTASFYNSSIGQTYYFTLNPSSSGVVAGQIPPGVYDVLIYPTSGYHRYNMSVYTHYQYGVTSFYGYGLSLDCGSCAVINITPN